MSAALTGLRDLANYASRMLAAKRPAPGTYWSDQGTRTEQYAASVLAENVLDLVVACIEDDEPKPTVPPGGVIASQYEMDELDALRVMRDQLAEAFEDTEHDNNYLLGRALAIVKAVPGR